MKTMIYSRQPPRRPALTSHNFSPFPYQFAGYRYGKDRTEHRKATEAGGIIGKGHTGYFWFCHAAGHLQGFRLRSHMMIPAGLEPCISGLKGRCPNL